MNPDQSGEKPTLSEMNLLNAPLFRSTSIDTQTIAQVEDLYRREQGELLRSLWSSADPLRSREEVLNAHLSEKIRDMSILEREVYERLFIESILEHRKEQNGRGPSDAFVLTLTDVLRLGASQELRDLYVNWSVRDQRGGLTYGLYTESRVEEFSYGKQGAAAQSIYGELIQDIFKNFNAPDELAKNLATHLGDPDIFHAISFFQSLNRHLYLQAIPPLQLRPIACALSTSVLLLTESLVPKLVSASESCKTKSLGGTDLTISNDELLDMHFRATFVCAMASCLFYLTQGNAHCFCALTDSLKAFNSTEELRSPVFEVLRDVQDYLSPLLAQCSVPASEVKRIVTRELEAFRAELATKIDIAQSGIKDFGSKIELLRNITHGNECWESLRERARVPWRLVPVF